MRVVVIWLNLVDKNSPLNFENISFLIIWLVATSIFYIETRRGSGDKNLLKKSWYKDCETGERN